jgi:hypothetical protein
MNAHGISCVRHCLRSERGQALCVQVCFGDHRGCEAYAVSSGCLCTQRQAPTMCSHSLNPQRQVIHSPHLHRAIAVRRCTASGQSKQQRAAACLARACSSGSRSRLNLTTSAPASVTRTEHGTNHDHFRAHSTTRSRTNSACPRMHATCSGVSPCESHKSIHSGRTSTISAQQSS